MNVILYWIATDCKEPPEIKAQQTIEIIRDLI
ncbi:hypothetical protein [Companilactobacillus musae]